MCGSLKTNKYVSKLVYYYTSKGTETVFMQKLLISLLRIGK